jgi:branched-chain amino acid transport system substrate-binding protein
MDGGTPLRTKIVGQTVSLGEQTDSLSYSFRGGKPMFTRKTQFVGWGLLLLLAALFTACRGPATGGFPKGPISVGVVTSLTGSHAAFGDAQESGYELALAEINAAGGIAGHPLELIYVDDTSSAEQAILAAEQLVTNEKVPLILGSYSSAATFAMAGVLEGYQTPLIVSSAATDALTEQGFQWIFRINAPSSRFAETIFDFLDDVRGSGSVAIIFESTDFGTSTARAAKQAADNRGFDVVVYEAYSANTSDFTPLVTAVMEAQPDVLIAVSYLNDALLLTEQARGLNFSPELFVGGAAGFASQGFIDGAGANAEFILTPSQWSSDVNWPGAGDFSRRYQELYGTAPGYHAAAAYAAVYVAADVLKRANSVDKEKIQAALLATDLQDTIFGPIKFDSTGQNDHQMLMMQIQKGDFVTVYPTEFAAAPIINPMPPWASR